MTCQKNVNKNNNMTKIGKLFARLKKLYIKSLIRLGVPFTAKASLNQKTLSFHDAASSIITEQILMDGFRSYEPELVKFFENYPYPFNSFIDAGANIGFYSILMHESFGDKISITAIEPFPTNIHYIETFQKNNELSFTLLPFALSEKDGEEKEFYVPTTHRSSKLPPAASLVNNYGTGALFENDKYNQITVKTISLNTVLDQTEGPHLMKLDIEGYELPVLESIKERLLSAQDLDLVVEIMINDKDKKEIFDLLIACGFDGYLVTNAGLIKEDRPLTLPYHNQNTTKHRTCWKNHFFTKRPECDISKLSEEIYGYFI